MFLECVGQAGANLNYRISVICISARNNAVAIGLGTGDGIMLGAGLGCWLLELSYRAESLAWP